MVTAAHRIARRSSYATNRHREKAEAHFRFRSMCVTVLTALALCGCGLLYAHQSLSLKWLRYRMNTVVDEKAQIMTENQQLRKNIAQMERLARIEGLLEEKAICLSEPTLPKVYIGSPKLDLTKELGRGRRICGVTQKYAQVYSWEHIGRY